MFFKRRKSGNNGGFNIMEMVPSRKIECKLKPEKNTVDIIMPRFKKSWLSKLVPPKKDPNIYIHLDTFGTFFWDKIDGRRTVMEIGQMMIDKLPTPMDNGLERAGFFARDLYKHGFIDISRPEE